ncbi:cell division protein FtsA [candidate division KSB1 bacterium]|nr:cell division protein FtsA [candidate division KSB1 bacterium]NIR71828.1 cell division protein FtsA [candidate division KSB1 bacterium]NIS25344.1 cell division protein FtsA [candidate division KSB1 bacterium]NIT71814.1 cell division protein FtsA [candidate division KSB1 bacterium]NIU25552.1 cell division protein FtsA [candidate division KSB1 bacterium]
MPEYIAGLDIGTTKIGAIIAEVDGSHMEPTIVGVGTSPSDGLRRGVVVNLDKTVRSIETALEEAEQMAGVQVNEVFAGIAGDHIRSINGRGVVAVAGPNNEITQADVRRVIDAAKAVALPIDREILHILPQEFTVDDQHGIKDPVGMSGVRLEAEVHIVTGAITSAQNIYRSIGRADMRVLDLVLEPLASSYAVLGNDEKELGVIVMDLGGGTIDIAMFFEGCVRHTAVVGLGGKNVTNDIAIGLRTPVDQAEQIKINHGHAIHRDEDRNETIEVPDVGGRSPRRISKAYLIDIIQPRMEEILSLAYREVKKSNYVHLMTSGLVLTGGGSMLNGTVELAEEIFDMPVKLGIPERFNGLRDLVRSPIHATGVGLIHYGIHHKFDANDFLGHDEHGMFYWVVNRMRRWFSGVHRYGH